MTYPTDLFNEVIVLKKKKSSNYITEQTQNLPKASCLSGKLNSFSVDKKNQLDVTFVLFISLLIVAQHVSGNHVPIIRS